MFPISATPFSGVGGTALPMKFLSNPVPMDSTLRRPAIAAAALLVFFQTVPVFAESHHQVRLVKTDAARVDIYIGKSLFASYHYGIGVHKPIFHPLLSPKGHRLTRAYPMEFGIPDEHYDHWHHEGISFTYGNLNGVDFWSKLPGGRDRPGSGRIRHTGFTRPEDGQKGVMETTSDWIAPSGKVLLKQDSRMTIEAGPGWGTLDLRFTLTAQEQRVTFNDTKEGMMAIRVAPELREDRTGRYLNAQGLELSKAVWGKKSSWVALRGSVQGEDLTLAIMNHPGSIEFPTFWHARGYGLFSANPFGRKDFQKGSPPLNSSLEPGESALFLYRILVHSGHLSRSRMAAQFESYRATKP